MLHCGSMRSYFIDIFRLFIWEMYLFSRLPCITEVQWDFTVFTGLELITNKERHERVTWKGIMMNTVDKRTNEKIRDCFDSSSSSSNSAYYHSLWIRKPKLKLHHSIRILSAADGHEETEPREMSDRQASRRPSYLCTPGGSQQQKHWCQTGRSGRDCWMCCSAAGELWCL